MSVSKFEAPNAEELRSAAAIALKHNEKRPVLKKILFRGKLTPERIIQLQRKAREIAGSEVEIGGQVKRFRQLYELGHRGLLEEYGSQPEDVLRANAQLEVQNRLASRTAPEGQVNPFDVLNEMIARNKQGVQEEWNDRVVADRLIDQYPIDRPSAYLPEDLRREYRGLYRRLVDIASFAKGVEEGELDEILGIERQTLNVDEIRDLPDEIADRSVFVARYVAGYPRSMPTDPFRLISREYAYRGDIECLTAGAKVDADRIVRVLGIGYVLTDILPGYEGDAPEIWRRWNTPVGPVGLAFRDREEMPQSFSNRST